MEDFAGFLGSEQFCYLLENVNGVIDDKILRVDLFRMIQPNENGGHDFTGGLFHANRHFSYKGFPLSTSKEKHDIFNFDQLLILICEAFFVHAGTFKTKSNYSVTMPISGNDNIRFEFFYEQKNGVYFLNTAFKQTD